MTDSDYPEPNDEAEAAKMASPEEKMIEEGPHPMETPTETFAEADEPAPDEVVEDRATTEGLAPTPEDSTEEDLLESDADEAPGEEPEAVEMTLEVADHTTEAASSEAAQTLPGDPLPSVATGAVAEELEDEVEAVMPLVQDEPAPEAPGLAQGEKALDEAETGLEIEAPPTEEEPDDGRRWYVVHCYSGYENKVRHNLEQRIETMGMKDRIFDVVVPTEEEIEVKDGKRRTVERRVFPGYILVQMLMGEESWYVVRNTPGVTGFVGMGNEPTPLRPEEVVQIVKRMEAEAPRIKVTYKSGQKVRIIDGPFNDFIGTVEAIDMERAKVRVMVSFFGRETPVELDFLQVEKA